MLPNSKIRFTYIEMMFVPHAGTMGGPLMFPESLVLSVDINPVLFVGNKSMAIEFVTARTHSLHVAQSVAGTLSSEEPRYISVVPRGVAALLVGTIAAMYMSMNYSRYDPIELTYQATIHGWSNCYLDQWKDPCPRTAGRRSIIFFRSRRLSKLTWVWSKRPPGYSVQHVSDTDELEHEAAPEVEQPELILLNNETGSAGLNEDFLS